MLEKIGPLMGDGIHDTDLMLWMSQARIETVYALEHSVRGLKNPDLGWAMYRFDSGAIGVIENIWMLPTGTPFRIHEQMEVIGTKGSIYIHGSDTNLVVQGPHGIDCPDTQYWPQIHGQAVGALQTEIALCGLCRAGCPAHGRNTSRCQSGRGGNVGCREVRPDGKSDSGRMKPADHCRRQFAINTPVFHRPRRTGLSRTSPTASTSNPVRRLSPFQTRTANDSSWRCPASGLKEFPREILER